MDKIARNRLLRTGVGLGHPVCLSCRWSAWCGFAVLSVVAPFDLSLCLPIGSATPSPESRPTALTSLYSVQELRFKLHPERIGGSEIDKDGVASEGRGRGRSFLCASLRQRWRSPVEVTTGARLGDEAGLRLKSRRGQDRFLVRLSPYAPIDRYPERTKRVPH